MKKLDLPNPEPPDDLGESYEFPNDPEKLSGMHLGQLMLRISSYLSYSTRLLGSIESDITLLDSFCKDAVAKFRMDNETKRMAADMMEAVAATQDIQLAELRTRKIRRLAIQAKLSAAVKSYEIQYSALSRELARRSMEYKMIQ